MSNKQGETPNIIIDLTPEQIEQLQPLGDALYNHHLETGERRMFTGQVITDGEGKFTCVQFGLIPPDQSIEIERIRGLDR